jgi:hypothetical protein
VFLGTSAVPNKAFAADRKKPRPLKSDVICKDGEVYMPENNAKSLVKFDDKEKILDIASLVSSAVPWVGGPVSNVLGGISTRTSEERNENKRKILKSFLVDAVKYPGEQYDDQLRFLKILENVYGDHIKVLQALMMPPDQDPGMMGSPSQTLSERLPDMTDDRINDLVTQLNDLRVSNLQSLNTMMTGGGAQNLTHSVTPLGKQFLKYLVGS